MNVTTYDRLDPHAAPAYDGDSTIAHRHIAPGSYPCTFTDTDDREWTGTLVVTVDGSSSHLLPEAPTGPAALPGLLEEYRAWAQDRQHLMDQTGPYDRATDMEDWGESDDVAIGILHRLAAIATQAASPWPAGSWAAAATAGEESERTTEDTELAGPARPVHPYRLTSVARFVLDAVLAAEGPVYGEVLKASAGFDYSGPDRPHRLDLSLADGTSVHIDISDGPQRHTTPSSHASSWTGTSS